MKSFDENGDAHGHIWESSGCKLPNESVLYIYKSLRLQTNMPKINGTPQI